MLSCWTCRFHDPFTGNESRISGAIGAAYLFTVHGYGAPRRSSGLRSQTPDSLTREPILWVQSGSLPTQFWGAASWFFYSG